MTRPILLKASNHTIDNPDDPTLQAWTLDWDLHELTTHPLNLFNANMFYPNGDTLAYSDHQVVNAVLGAPIMAVTGNPVQTANYLLIFNFFLCGLGAYLLAYHLTGNRLAGVFAGIAFAYVPNRLAHVTHLNLTSAGWMPLTLLFMHKYAEEKKTKDLILMAAFFVLQTLVAWHYGLMLALLILLFFVVRLITMRPAVTLRWTLTLVLALACAFVVIYPFARPYLNLQKQDPNYVRTRTEVDAFSSDVQDFFVAPRENLVWGTITRGIRSNIDSRGGEERAIFPGMLALLLGVFGTVVLFRGGKGEQRFTAWFYSAAVVFSAVFSLGTVLWVFGHKYSIPMPYWVLYYLVPGFKGMRVPPRFSVVTALGLAVLAAFGFKWIVTKVNKKKGVKASAVVSVVILVLLVVELMSISLPTVKVPVKGQFPAVYHWLATQEGETPTLEYPVATYDPKTSQPGTMQYSETWLLFEPMRVYYSTLHWKKILNGFSGYVPQSYYDAVRELNGFPTKSGMAFLKKEKLRYLIVHGGQTDPTTLARLAAWNKTHSDLKLVKTFGSDRVYAVQK